MRHPLHRAGLMVATALVVGVVTQILYMLLLGGPSPAEPGGAVTHADRALYFTERWPVIATVWTVELAATVALAAGALVALARGAAVPSAWAALALAGLFNALQVGTGLSMFQPAITAGDALEPLFTTVLAGAFLFYFLAKVLIGLAGVGLGVALVALPGPWCKSVGVAAILGGAGAAVANILAITVGRSLTFPAGATGTAAALTAALAILFLQGVAGRGLAHRTAVPLDSPSPTR